MSGHSISTSTRLMPEQVRKSGHLKQKDRSIPPRYLDDEVVYIGSRDHHLYALNHEDGSEIWRYDTGGEVWSSPALVDGIVYTGSRNGDMFALDAVSGEEIWTFSTGSNSPINASPAILDDVLYSGAGNGIFYALDRTTGEEIWSLDLEGGQIFASASVTDDAIYVFAIDGILHALSLDGERLWTFPLGSPTYSSPTVVGDVVYALSEAGGLMYALDTTSGEALWHYQTGSEGDWRSAHPVFENGILYITSNTRGLIALSAP